MVIGEQVTVTASLATAVITGVEVVFWFIAGRNHIPYRGATQPAAAASNTAVSSKQHSSQQQQQSPASAHSAITSSYRASCSSSLLAEVDLVMICITKLPLLLLAAVIPSVLHVMICILAVMMIMMISNLRLR